MPTDSGAHVTLEDVARHAGVSLATASRALNGSERKVREDLRAKVHASAAKLNYAVNAHAQAMARGRTNVVGLVVHDIADPFFSTIAAGMMHRADEHDLLLTLASTELSLERELQHVIALRAQRARAVVLAGSRWASAPRRGPLGQELKAFEAGGGRAVLIGQPRLDVDTIVVENRAGARALVKELNAMGYQRFGVLAGPADLLAASDRHQGFKKGAAEAGTPLAGNAVVHGDFTRDGGYEAVGRLLAQAPDVDCVLAVNDVMAVGAIAALRDMAVRVPDDVAVAGFDDISTLRDVTPSLTTVRIPLRTMGAMAIEMVLEPAADRRRIRRVKGEVVIRTSTPVRGR